MKKWSFSITLLLLTSISLWGAYPVTLVGWTGQPQFVFNEIQKRIDKIQEAIGSDKDTLASNLQDLRDASDRTRALAFQLGQIQSLSDTGKLLVPTQAPADSVSANGLSGAIVPSNSINYDPSSGKFVGGNFGYVDNIVGHSGLPVGMDTVLPVATQAISPGDVPVFQQMSQGFLSNSSGSFAGNLVRSLSYFANPVGSQLLNQALSQSSGASGSSAWSQLIGSGAYPIANSVMVRSLSPSDSTYGSLFTGGTASDMMGFYINQTAQNPSYSWNPYTGYTSIPGAGPNVSDIISQGQLTALNAYYQNTKSTDQSALIMSSVINNSGSILQQLAMTKPGQPLVVSGAGATAYYLPVWKLRRGGFVMVSSSATSGPGVVAQANQSTISEFQAKMTANKNALSQSVAQERSNAQLVKWQQDVVTHLKKVRSDVEGIRSRMTAQNAIPEVTQLVAFIDSTVLQRQDEISKLNNEIENCRAHQRDILQEREKIREKYLVEAEQEAAGNLHSAFNNFDATKAASSNSSTNPTSSAN